MALSNILCGIFVLLFLITFFLGSIATVTMLNNEKEEFVVDCYDKKGNIINNVTCIEERYYCNKFQSFFMGDDCIKEMEIGRT